MHKSALRAYRCPISRGTFEVVTDGNSPELLEAELQCSCGHRYRVVNGVPVFLLDEHIYGKSSEAIEYYTKTAEVYDEYLPVAFELYNADEHNVRKTLTDLLPTENAPKILELTAGTGKDSEYIAKRMMHKGELWMMDITINMLELAKKKMAHSPIFKEFTVASACALPFTDNYFDALFSFTGFGSFPDPKKALLEMERVVRPGGRVVFCEKSVPPWLRETEYGKILIEANPMFAEEIPLKYLPANAAEVEVRWIMDNAFYVISYTVGPETPKGNFSLELPGSRGGTFLTRYYGKLEGVLPETKALAQKARDKSGKSMHKWLDEVVKKAALEQLNDQI
jgi:ubiquinone/menaquinone biosynthesis C-methylase UbiE